MLKAGVFRTSTLDLLVYEVIERNFYRLDILNNGDIFNVDIPLYSMVRRKLDTYTFGDTNLFTQYDSALMKAASIKKTTTKTQGWEDRKFITTITAVNEKFNCKVVTKLENAIEMVVTTMIDDVLIELAVMDKVYGVATLPTNFKEYQKVVVIEDNLEEVTTAPFFSLETLQRRYDIAHIDENDNCVADTLEVARQRLKEWVEADELVKGFDTETTGLDVSLYGEDHLVGIILGENETKATYFPFRHVSGLQNLPIQFLRELMPQVIQQQSILVAHNKKFDRQVMLKEGYDILIKYDTLWGSMILNPVMGKGIHDEKTLVYQLEGKQYLELDQIFISKSDINFGILTKEIVERYACPDGYNVIKLYKDQLVKIPQKQLKLWELENDLADVCADMEYYGIRVDVQKYEAQYKNCNYIIEQLLDAFRTLTHEDGNINSPEVLANLIYNKMHCPVVKRTKTGAPSTSSAVIKMLGKKKAKIPHNVTQDLVDLNGKPIITAKELSESAYPAMLILAKYKEYNKLKTAFYARFERTMSTGRVFFWLNQWGAQTGRQSSPMHQLPPDLKDCILSDSPQKDFWGPDYSQVELRMIAYLAGEKDLIELAKNPDNDIHRIIGSLISGLEMWQITPEMRSQGKRRNFGVVYLISAMGLAGQMFGPAFTKENVKFCQQQLDDFYHSFKRIDRYIKNNGQLVQQQGYMETRWFHRVRLFPDIFDPNLEPRRKASILRMSNNVPVQGTSADLMKLAEVQMYKWIRARGWNEPAEDGFPKVRMMLSIHDELIISADRSLPYEEIITMITKCMDIPVKGAPPFFVQPALMDNWGGHSDDACAMPIRLRDKLIEDYVRTGKSVINHDNYLQVLEDFRAQTLHDYMGGLITKYGPDYHNVGEHVRDGALTFQLLDLYSKELKKLPKDIEQADRITEATRLYMENNGEAVAEAMAEQVVEEAKPVADKDLFSQELEDMVTFDPDGNPIYEDDNFEDIDMVSDDEEEEIDLRVSATPTYAWELGDNITVDTQELVNQENINKILQFMMKYQQADGFYNSYIIYNDQLLDTKIRMEHCDIEELNNYVIELVNFEKQGRTA